MVTVYVSAYNKASYLKSVIKTLNVASEKAGKLKLDIIIVDDASTDNTQDVINALKKKYKFVRSIHHDKNQGLGVGFRETIKLAKYPKLLYVPGDDEADLFLVTSLFKNRNKADVILSYFLNREVRGRWRNFLSTFYGMIYMLTFDVYAQYFNGSGLYSVDKLRKIILHANRFSITAEINTKLLCRGCSYYEVAGYNKTGAVSSTAFSFRNFREVIRTYFRLIYEMKFAKREFFNKKPIRIYDRLTF